MSYVLLRMDEATLLADGPVLPAADVALVGELSTLLREVRDERAALAAARDAGAEAGRAAGRAEGRAEGLVAAREEAGAALADALSALREARRDAERQAGSLAVEIVRRLLPNLAGDVLLPGLLASALDELREEAPHALAAHPDDLTALADALRGTGLASYPDERLPRGTIRLETAGGTAEVGLDARLDALREAMRG